MIEYMINVRFYKGISIMTLQFIMHSLSFVLLFYFSDKEFIFLGFPTLKISRRIRKEIPKRNCKK